MSDTPTVTLSMFWPLLMQAAGNEHNVNWHAIPDRIHARTGIALDRISREDVAEEMAREHFPSGTTEEVVGFYRMESGGWMTDQDCFDRFDDMALNRCGPGYEAEPIFYPDYNGGLLSPTDPHHVAMVVRILAISQSLPVYVEGPNVTTRHYDKWLVEDSENVGPGILLYLDRTRPARSSAEPASVGYFFSYRPGESAENFNVADALFRWMVARHTEIVKATEADDAAESGKDSEPTQANVIEFKAT